MDFASPWPARRAGGCLMSCLSRRPLSMIFLFWTPASDGPLLAQAARLPAWSRTEFWYALARQSAESLPGRWLEGSWPESSTAGLSWLSSPSASSFSLPKLITWTLPVWRCPAKIDATERGAGYAWRNRATSLLRSTRRLPGSARAPHCSLRLRCDPSAIYLGAKRWKN